MTEPNAPARACWIPPEWITVRDYAARHGLSTGDITRLQQHGKSAMAELRGRGFTTMPKVWEQADSGQWFWVYVYPADVVAKTAWSVYR